MPRLGVLLSAVLSLLVIATARADDAASAGDLLTYDFQIAQDYSYVLTVTGESTIRTPEDAAGHSEQAVTFDPATSSVRFVEAWVQEPDGTRQEPAPNSVLVRPSEAARNSPGFVSTQTATLILPQLRIGSRVHVAYQLTVKTLPLFGFNEAFVPSRTGVGTLGVSIRLPKDLPLTIGQEGGFEVSDTSSGDTRTITAQLRLTHPLVTDEEPHALPIVETGPIFMASSLKSYEEIGAIYQRNSIDKIAVTPDIKALAARIVGDRTGPDAAHAIHDWMTDNIRYLAVWLDEGATLVPHDAATVLKNGYGDCKDHVALMQALLAAVGIRSAPALINLGDIYTPPPVPFSSMFNHVIVYLPDYDLFDDPTDQFAAFGVLDRTLAGKTVVIAAEQPAMKTTPALTPASAAFEATSRIAIEADGTMAGDLTATMTPVVAAELRALLASHADAARQMEARLGSTLEGGFGRIRTTDPENLDTPFEIRASWTSPHGIAPDAPYMMLPVGPNFAPVPALRGYLTRTAKRTLPFELDIVDVTWTSTISLPDGWSLKALPPAVSVDNGVGAYTAAYTLDGAQLAVHRHLVLKQRVVQPQDYADLQSVIYALVDDMHAIVALDRAQ
ncbi:protein of unknown function [Pseudoxanthobacter soli DSM 19599]|uniref:Transglutaminase-like superfamily protein n=1 Tax=Pseudoxanthobacter soli DSM 19599 TaxID=1123029 RepID=A0A1M7ZFA8_9HYPH|nr:DUF3857 domain-containing protein [Pseudoxanthobacter soli]SHO63522.1 protein of unknown function [Pseudoxanthobacter soli DSM 19599]